MIGNGVQSEVPENGRKVHAGASGASRSGAAEPSGGKVGRRGRPYPKQVEVSIPNAPRAIPGRPRLYTVIIDRVTAYKVA